MDTERAAELLAETELFGNLAADSLSGLAERTISRTIEKGQAVFWEGEDGRTLYVVVDGHVKVTVSSPEGEEMVMATLRPPQVFGELSLVDGGDRSATAIAVERTTLLGLDRDALIHVLRHYPTPVDDLLRTLGGLIRRLTDQASDLVFLDLQGRVAKLILAIAERDGSSSEASPVVDIGLTQTELAEMVGGTRQSLNQALHAFERRGWIALEGRQITVLDHQALRRRAGM
jgi:CRP/FNR family transcriptional regulator, cyclic AMP receptor protein